MKLTLYGRTVDGKDVELTTTYPPFTAKEAEDFERKTGQRADHFAKLIDERNVTALRWLWAWFHNRNGQPMRWEDADFDLTAYALRIEREPGDPGYVENGDNSIDGSTEDDDLPTTSEQEGGDETTAA